MASVTRLQSSNRRERCIAEVGAAYSRAPHKSPITIDDGKVGTAFYSAWKEVAPPGSVLASCGLPQRYFQQEIERVIKGRGLRSASAYLKLQRSGRGTPLNANLRGEVWALRDEYEHHLRKRKTSDWNDLISEALMLVRERGLDVPYLSVVVDECQDLTENAVRLVYELAGRSKPDGLVLLGDGQQSVYPGGYSLGALGINVVGRSTVLRINYRNTKEILQTASRIVANRAFDDNMEAVELGRQDVEVLRSGREPELAGFDDADDHDEALTLAIAAAVKRPGTTPGDVAVLVPTNAMVAQYTSLISGLGFPAQKLSDYEGVRNSRVKVGTYQRSKGLEFKAVFLARLDPETLREDRQANEDAETHAERVDLLARNVYVGMTRARDELWGGWVGRPAALLRL